MPLSEINKVLKKHLKPIGIKRLLYISLYSMIMVCGMSFTILSETGN